MRRLTQRTERCGRGALRVTALFTLLSALLVVPAAASAADFNPTAGTYAVDTTTLKLTGPGGTDITGVAEGGVGVFRFGTVNIGASVIVNVRGNRPFKIVASGNLTVAGVIDGVGGSATDGTRGPVAGGPGGAAGGAEFGNAGAGPGGGGSPPTPNDGAGGGGFGGKGARGGLTAGGPAGAGGLAYGNLKLALQGGSGGGGSSTGDFFGGVGGGGGGGAIALFGSTVRIPLGGSVRVDGGHGACGGTGASGGGSGGGIVVHGETVEVRGTVSARGGQGGSGGTDGDGGGGGGGRISYEYRNLVAGGAPVVVGGTTGSRSLAGCAPKNVSPDPTGATGIFTKFQGASATTALASSVSQNGATLNGVVNPHSTATNYHFDFGTTTGYGSRVPATHAFAGADAANHVVSQSVSGLAPNTTYHYRLVTTDALGFTVFGADVAFTTPAVPAPPPGGTQPPLPPQKLTQVGSSIRNHFLGFKKFTKIDQLSVNGLPTGSRVKVQCKTKKKSQQKKGPYKSKTFAKAGSINLLQAVQEEEAPARDAASRSRSPRRASSARR